MYEEPNRNPAGSPLFKARDPRDFNAKSGQHSELKPCGRGGIPKATIKNTGLLDLRD